MKLLKLKNELKKEQNINTNNIKNTINIQKNTNQNINNPKFFI
jgi:hypothetical protein